MSTVYESRLLGGLSFVRQPLSFRFLDRDDSPLPVIQMPGAVLVSELVNVAVQVLFRDRVEGPNQAALDDGEETLNGVRVDVPAHVFPEVCTWRKRLGRTSEAMPQTAAPSVMNTRYAVRDGLKK